jgi:Bacterial Ig-like domain
MQLKLKKIIYYMLFWGFVLEISSCAKVGSLQGGPEDLTPPKMDTLRSTPNYTTNFKGRSIELRFNEWIELADVPKQVIISPPLAKRPEISVKGKVVRVKFEENEKLRPNTTYTINFGNAVKDFTKGNPAKDLRFVFSTGDVIDKLQVSGTVADALTGDPLENISILMYDKMEDSIIRKEKPFYVAQSDKSGQFTIQNVHSGQYKVAAIEDGNANLTWESNEKIGFLATPLVVQDSGYNVVSMVLSKEQAAFKLLDKEYSRYGSVRLIYSQPPTQIVPVPELPNLKYLIERGGDTLMLWYDLPENTNATSWNILVAKDTVKVKVFPREEFIKNKKIAFTGEIASAAVTKGRGGRQTPTTATTSGKTPSINPIKNINQNPFKTLVLDFIVPINAIDREKWFLTMDSTVLPLQNYSTEADSLSKRKIRFTHTWVAGKKYALTLLPGALTDFWGSLNTDTLRRTITVLNDKQLASMKVTLQGLTMEKNYILQILNGTTLEMQRLFKAHATSFEADFANIPLGTYSVKVIEEALVNGRWDGADYFLHRQPERIFMKKLEPLQPSFESVVVFDLGVKEVEKKRGKEEEKKGRKQ